jgi:hypothetical protein
MAAFGGAKRAAVNQNFLDIFTNMSKKFCLAALFNTADWLQQYHE